ncbi:MAG: ABC transporter permease [Dehalococcoidia bacterium]
MRVVLYIARRLLFVVPQAIGISVVTFVLVRVLPGDPALVLLGTNATESSIQAVEERLGLDKPLYEQYWLYIKDVAQGDLGTSLITGNPVREDLLDRLPATLELILLGLLLSLLIGIPLGVITALSGSKGWPDRLTSPYGLFAGSIPDFWVGLILILIFYRYLDWVPAPLGQIQIGVSPPDKITGMYVVDSVLTGNWEAFKSSGSRLILPLATLVFVYTAPIVKMTRSSMDEVLNSGFVDHFEALGLSRRSIVLKALKNALPPVVTILGVLFGYLLGGAVLVEIVFSWGGAGQYAVQAIANADFAAIQGFVLIAAVFSLLTYLVVDLLYFALDPRIKY